MSPSDIMYPSQSLQEAATAAFPSSPVSSPTKSAGKRVAFVGCGKIAKTHALALQDLGFECAAVMDQLPETAEQFARHYAELRADWLLAPEWCSARARKTLRGMFRAPKVYPSLDAIIDAGPLDAFIIATPPPSHCELVCRAAALGVKTILCEKPMAMSAAQCRTMIETCKRHGVRLAVFNHALLLLRQIGIARNLVLTGQIGKVEFIRANTTSSLMDYSSYLWAGIERVLAGNILQVEALLDCTSKIIRYGHAQENRATVHFGMNNGVHGMLFTGRQEFSPHGIRIDGSEGSLEISYLTAPLLRHWRQGTKSWEVVTPPRDSTYSELRAFIEGVVNNDPDFAGFDGEHALRSMLPVFAAWQSHFERRSLLMSDAITFEVPTHF
jgi:predicted dehydrogenase